MRRQRRKALQGGHCVAHIIGKCLHSEQRSIEDVNISDDPWDLDLLALSYAASRSTRSNLIVRLQFISDESPHRRPPWTCMRRRSPFWRLHLARRMRGANSNGAGGEACGGASSHRRQRSTGRPVVDDRPCVRRGHCGLEAIPTRGGRHPGSGGHVRRLAARDPVSTPRALPPATANAARSRRGGLPPRSGLQRGIEPPVTRVRNLEVVLPGPACREPFLRRRARSRSSGRSDGRASERTARCRASRNCRTRACQR